MADEVNATQTDAGTGASQVDSAAAARAAAAAAQTAAAQAAASGALAQEETIADIGQGEAYIVNMKRLVENALTFDEKVKEISLQNLQLGQIALQNAVALSNRVNNNSADLDLRTKQDSLDSKVKCEGINQKEREETARNSAAMNVIREFGLSENPIYQDALVAAVVAAVDRYMSEGQSSSGSGGHGHK